MAVGDLIRTRKGWTVVPPTACPNGHPLTGGRVLVGHMPCAGPFPGGHTTWSCRACDATVYAPALTEQCELIHGAAKVRNL